MDFITCKTCKYFNKNFCNIHKEQVIDEKEFFAVMNSLMDFICKEGEAYLSTVIHKIGILLNEANNKSMKKEGITNVTEFDFSTFLILMNNYAYNKALKFHYKREDRSYEIIVMMDQMIEGASDQAFGSVKKKCFNLTKKLKKDIIKHLYPKFSCRHAEDIFGNKNSDIMINHSNRVNRKIRI